MYYSDSTGQLTHHIINNRHHNNFNNPRLKERATILYNVAFFFFFISITTTAQSGLNIWFYFGWGQFKQYRTRNGEEAGLEYIASEL